MVKSDYRPGGDDAITVSTWRSGCHHRFRANWSFVVAAFVSVARRNWPCSSRSGSGSRPVTDRWCSSVVSPERVSRA